MTRGDLAMRFPLMLMGAEQLRCQAPQLKVYPKDCIMWASAVFHWEEVILFLSSLLRQVDNWQLLWITDLTYKKRSSEKSG